MDSTAFLEAVQSRAARIAIGASTVRGRGNTGTVAACRRYLRVIDLASFASPDAATFVSALDDHTERLQASLPPPARHWGIARKALNIFLRDALYTTYLNERFSLRQAEPFFEVPLDMLTATQIKRASGRASLPAWPGVKHILPPLSQQFQTAADAQAARAGIARVHLDAVWWSVARDETNLVLET